MTEDVLSRESIRVGGVAASRDDAIRQAGQLLVDLGAVGASYVESMLEREGSVSTYMGNYLAIPHGTNDAKGEIVRSAVSLIRYDQPIDWDGNEVRFAVGIAGVGDEHLDLLAKLAIVFSDDDQVESLVNAAGPDEIYAILEEVNVE